MNIFNFCLIGAMATQASAKGKPGNLPKGPPEDLYLGPPVSAEDLPDGLPPELLQQQYTTIPTLCALACGSSSNKCKGKTVPGYVLDPHPLRCCSDTEKEGWMKRERCDIWSQSEFDGNCYDEVNFFEAFLVCAKQGGEWSLSIIDFTFCECSTCGLFFWNLSLVFSYASQRGFAARTNFSVTALADLDVGTMVGWSGLLIPGSHALLMPNARMDWSAPLIPAEVMESARSMTSVTASLLLAVEHWMGIAVTGRRGKQTLPSISTMSVAALTRLSQASCSTQRALPRSVPYMVRRKWVRLERSAKNSRLTMKPWQLVMLWRPGFAPLTNFSMIVQRILDAALTIESVGHQRYWHNGIIWDVIKAKLDNDVVSCSMLSMLNGNSRSARKCLAELRQYGMMGLLCDMVRGENVLWKVAAVIFMNAYRYSGMYILGGIIHCLHSVQKYRFIWAWEWYLFSWLKNERFVWYTKQIIEPIQIQ